MICDVRTQKSRLKCKIKFDFYYRLRDKYKPKKIKFKGLKK